MEEMTFKYQHLTFTKQDKNEPREYELLLLADPSKDLVDQYLEQSDTFIARQNEETLGIVILLPLTEEIIEIKNIAVKPEFQGQGIGSYLIENAIKVAALKKYKKILIGTANSSIGQLYLYQKLGFEISEIRKNFFTDNYAEPIYENGVQAKHMLILAKQL
ncbi:MAG: acetyltransferase [Bacteroidetes bacterium]|jgi:aminoglycoside 6'-N-acetyltransferase I|nr:acetyltransferase [Bacteroidota bacterium]